MCFVFIGLSYGRGGGVGRGLGVSAGLGVGVAVGDAVAVTVGVGVEPGAAAQYLPPVFRALLASYPPQTIISLPVQTAVWDSRAAGALVVLVASQVLVLG
jgi:DNA-binding transcriptional LysR family regulator